MDFTSLLQNGVALLQKGRAAPALECFLQAARLAPQHPQPPYLAGLACELDGRHQDAAAHLRHALELQPENAEAALRLGALLQGAGEYAEARRWLQRAVALLPNDPHPRLALAAVLLQLGEVKASRAAAAKAMELAKDPAGMAAALDTLGSAAMALGDLAAARGHYEKALELAPGEAATWSNLGVTLKETGELDQAVAAYGRALELHPHDPDTLCNLANAWQALGDADACLAQFQRALEIAPEHPAALWGSVFAQLRPVYDSHEQLVAARAAYDTALLSLESALPSPSSPEDVQRLQRMARAVGANQPYYLTYQGLNDRPLQQRYGALVHRVMTAACPELAAPLPSRPGPEPRRRLRVGIVSGFLHEHSMWKIPTAGWASQLDRERFEVFGYYTAAKHDHCTETARASFDELVQEPNDFQGLCRTISGHGLDALLFPEVGMDPATARLAALRFAPVQAVSLGHPMTTGLPTMDHFLSSELMEPRGEDPDAPAEQWYSENLVLLPNLGIHYEPLRSCADAPPLSREDFSLPQGRVLLFCPQTLPKYLPQYDYLFADIAARAPQAFFVFLAGGRMRRAHEIFQARLQRAFARRGLDARQHMALLPQQPPQRYLALNQCCDIFLDSVGWSGFNTSMEAAGCGLPAVSHPCGGMRGRHGSAVLRMLRHDEQIAATLEDYTALAARLVEDDALRSAWRERTLANSQRLYRDHTAIRGLERFLEGAVQEA